MYSSTQYKCMAHWFFSQTKFALRGWAYELKFLTYRILFLSYGHTHTHTRVVSMYACLYMYVCVCVSFWTYSFMRQGPVQCRSSLSTSSAPADRQRTVSLEKSSARNAQMRFRDFLKGRVSFYLWSNMVFPSTKNTTSCLSDLRQVRKEESWNTVINWVLFLL